jgi:4-hydroxy-tetrahydrodipicolinate synthase
MTNTSKPSPWNWERVLCGVVPPLISPLTDTGAADAAAMEVLVQHILGGGGTGLFVLGGCGEGAWLTADQRSGVVRTAVRAVDGRAPVLAGVMLPSTGLAIEAAKRAADDGAAAIVAGSPYYMTVDSAAQERHIEMLLDAVDLPLLLYNIPPATHHVLAPEMVARLAREERVLGIKDSAGDPQAFLGLLAVKETRPHFRVLQGNEHFMGASLLLGADGLVPGLGNVVPALFVSLVQVARAGEVAAVRRLQAKIEDLGTLHSHGHWLPALKAACAMSGIGNGRPAPPLALPSEAQRKSIAAILRRNEVALHSN